MAEHACVAMRLTTGLVGEVATGSNSSSSRTMSCSSCCTTLELCFATIVGIPSTAGRLSSPEAETSFSPFPTSGTRSMTALCKGLKSVLNQ